MDNFLWWREKAHSVALGWARGGFLPPYVYFGPSPPGLSLAGEDALDLDLVAAGVAVAGVHPRPVRREAQRLDRVVQLPRAGQLAARGVPQPQRPVVPAGRQQPGVGAERQARHRLVVPRQLADDPVG